MYLPDWCLPVFATQGGHGDPPLQKVQKRYGWSNVEVRVFYALTWDSQFVVAFAFNVDVDFDVSGGPRWARYEKSCFLYIRYLTSACLRHDFYVMPSSEALQKIIFFMPFGGSFSFRYLFFWTSKRKGTTLVS